MVRWFHDHKEMNELGIRRSDVEMTRKTLFSRLAIGRPRSSTVQLVAGFLCCGTIELAESILENLQPND